MARSVFQGRRDVLWLARRIVLQNFLMRSARRKQIRHVLEADAQSPNAITPAALVGVHGDAERFAHYASIFSAARNADCGISTLPNWRIRFLPSFCLSSSFRLREMSPP